MFVSATAIPGVLLGARDSLHGQACLIANCNILHQQVPKSAWVLKPSQDHDCLGLNMFLATKTLLIRTLCRGGGS